MLLSLELTRQDAKDDKDDKDNKEKHSGKRES
jgi:hypothetical protein